jgi:hypothetical protein
MERRFLRPMRGSLQVSRRPMIAVLLCSLFVCGCDADTVRRPPEAGGPLPVRSEVEVVERKLSRLPCIDDIKTWRREYFYGYSKNNNVFDRSKLQFNLELSAGDLVKPGVVLLPPGGLPNLDDRDIIVASGLFDKTSGVVNLKHCGRNLP